jgi:hypothetical protein
MRWFWIMALATLLLVGCATDPDKVPESQLSEIRNIIRVDPDYQNGYIYYVVWYEENGLLRTKGFGPDSKFVVGDENRAVYVDSMYPTAKVFVARDIIKEK